MEKPPKTYDEQLRLLESRGLIITDRQHALSCLAHYNYYRLSAYRFPFTDRGNPDQFVKGATFTQLCRLYEFDARLRLLLFEACEKLEVSLRARWAYEVGHQLGPLAYLDHGHFADAALHASSLATLRKEIDRSNETFIEHHKYTLGMEWPPVWVATEVASFGTVSKFYANLKSSRLRQDIADSYQLDEWNMSSIAHHLSVVRNLTAHHSRLWNRVFPFAPRLPRKRPTPLADSVCVQQQRAKIYNTLTLLAHFQHVLDNTENWRAMTKLHIDTLAPNLIFQMGFPVDWVKRPLWRL